MYSPLSYMCVLYLLKECGHFLIETNLNPFNAWRKDDKTRSKMSQLFFVPIIFRCSLLPWNIIGTFPISRGPHILSRNFHARLNFRCDIHCIYCNRWKFCHKLWHINHFYSSNGGFMDRMLCKMACNPDQLPFSWPNYIPLPSCSTFL